MNVLVLPLSFWLAAAVFCCTASAEIITARSSSRQFLAREIQGPASPLSAPESIQTRMANGWGFLLVARRNGSDTDPSSIQLEPSLLVVSCERLKSLFLAQLGVDDQWQGRVTLLINPALDEHTEPRLTAMYYPD